MRLRLNWEITIDRARFDPPRIVIPKACVELVHKELGTRLSVQRSTQTLTLYDIQKVLGTALFWARMTWRKRAKEAHASNTQA